MAQANSLHDTSPVTPLPGADDARPHVIWRYSNNLHLQLSKFIGREHELDPLKPQLWSTRLLTLIGPGGCSKTRLPPQVAAEQLDAFVYEGWLVGHAQRSL